MEECPKPKFFGGGVLNTSIKLKSHDTPEVKRSPALLLHAPKKWAQFDTLDLGGPGKEHTPFLVPRPIIELSLEVFGSFST